MLVTYETVLVQLWWLTREELGKLCLWKTSRRARFYTEWRSDNRSLNFSEMNAIEI